MGDIVDLWGTMNLAAGIGVAGSYIDLHLQLPSAGIHSQGQIQIIFVVIFYD
jgi:hypothetical protein